MNLIDVTLMLNDEIAEGLAKGRYERVGGVIRKKTTKQVVAWLREALGPASEGDVSKPLDLSPIGSAASILNLAVSTMGFAVVMSRLGVIEQELQQRQEILRWVDRKIDLSFYANFRAALDLANNAFMMSNLENRKMSAMQAINRFLEAEQHYKHLVDLELEQGSQFADEYLLTLVLAYIAEARCYLQLEEVETAHRRLKQGIVDLRPRFEKLVNTLLTSNPAAYLHPGLKGQIDLRRLTKVYQWLDPGWDENSVFEAQRENLFRLAQQSQEWIDSLPPAFHVIETSHLARLKEALPSLPKSFSRRKKVPKKENTTAIIYEHLPEKLEVIESLIENESRFQMYGVEIEAIRQLGMSFEDWVRLTPSSDVQAASAKLVYLVPPQPLKLAA